MQRPSSGSCASSADSESFTQRRCTVQIGSLSSFLRYACKPCRYRQVDDRIFISYRQADSLRVAKNLERLLAAEFGDAHVFRDQVSIEAGERFPETIELWLRSSTAILVVV